MDVKDVEQALTALADRFEELGDPRALELRQLVNRPAAVPAGSGYRHRFIAAGNCWIVEWIVEQSKFWRALGFSQKYRVKEIVSYDYTPMKFKTEAAAIEWIKVRVAANAAEELDRKLLAGEM